MGGSPAEGWNDELERWRAPFLGRPRRQAQRRRAPFYLKGLLLPGERKSVEPMAARVAPADTQQLHHFVSASPRGRSRPRSPRSACARPTAR
jgi:SRSO17 transposase